MTTLTIDAMTESAPAESTWQSFVPGILLTLIVLFNMWIYRGDLAAVGFSNDAAMHEQMTVFASNTLSHWHFPMDRWMPNLNLGSPQFLHYQGTGATLVGLIGILIGPLTAFRWALFLMMSLWPLAIYFSARIMRLPLVSSLAAALVSPFVFSTIGIGYEVKAYAWTGYGVWAQLCASCVLPFAWAWTIRACEDRRYALRAALFISLTCALHFETGYMAMVGIVLAPLLTMTSFKKRLQNAAIVLAGALIGTSWITVPLLVNAKWAAINTSQANTPFALGYGASKNLAWLFGGNYFDYQRWPILTILVFIGILAAIVRWRTELANRGPLVFFAFIFLLSFGPKTWGSLIDIVPGHADIFFRRFMGPAQLAAMYLMGIGVSFAASVLTRLVATIRKREKAPLTTSLTGSAVKAGFALAILATAIAIPHAYHFGRINTKNTQLEANLEAQSNVDIGPIIAFLKTVDKGRVYAGTPYNWGRTFRYGFGPMYLYLANQNVDQISTEAWAASLMEEPQNLFNQNNPADYQIFGVRYLLMPATMKTPVPANLLMKSGRFALWEIPTNTYFSVVQAEGQISESKSTIAREAPVILNTSYFSSHVDFLVNYGGPAKVDAYPTAPLKSAPGTIVSENIDLNNGIASGVFSMHQTANVVLSASFDPGWQAYVDGQPVATQMVAPALVSVPVPAGLHRVTFRYRGFQWYLPLFLFTLLGLMGIWLITRPNEAVSTDEPAAALTND